MIEEVPAYIRHSAVEAAGRASGRVRLRSFTLVGGFNEG
jgi:hypothetical protein